MESCDSWEGRKRSQAPIQGLQEVVRKGNAPSSVTVLLSRGRNPRKAQGVVLGGAAWPRWEEASDPEGAGKEGCCRTVCAVAWGKEDKRLGGEGQCASGTWRETRHGGGRNWEDRGFNSEDTGEPWKVCEQRNNLAGLVCSRAPSGGHQGNILWGALVDAGRPRRGQWCWFGWKMI